jgi:hypothetical protein
MTKVHGFRWLGGIIIAAAVAAGATRLCAADPAGADAAPANPAAASSSATVDMFDAMHDGDLGVQFIPRSSRDATLILTNNTDRPLNVHLPEAFAAIPVVAQLGGAGAGGGNRSTGTGNSKNQGLGGGAGGQNNNRQGGGGFGGAVANGQAAPANAQAANAPNGGAFSIPPERVVKIKLPTVCLEYGKAEPNPRVPYTVVPIESFTTNTEVQELCKLLGAGTLDQQSAQAAAWHLANHLSWDQLADMKHFPHNSGFTRAVFSPDQIRAAVAITDKAIKMADAHPAAIPAADKKPAPSTASPASTSTPATTSTTPSAAPALDAAKLN